MVFSQYWSTRFIVFIYCFLSLSYAQNLPEENKSKKNELSFWSDTKESLSWMIEGSYLQFTQTNNLYYAAAGVPTVWYAFENDKRIQARYGKTEIANIVDHVGDAGVVFNFPVLHTGFYLLGKKTGNNHHVQFAKEYFAAMYLALLETGVLSYLYVHKRPNTDDTSFWEEKFRGKSSWPSGHVIPYTSLIFKVMQFYGPKWATIPVVLAVFASMQRVQDDKHWLSDVTASFFISAWASEGVRAAAKYKNNHPFYKWVFEKDVRIGVSRYYDQLGPALSFKF